MTYYLKYLFIIELRFDAILHYKSGKENSDAGHIKCSRGPHLARGPQVPYPYSKRYVSLEKIWKDKAVRTPTPKDLLHSLGFSIAAYTLDYWLLKTFDKRSVEAFKLWCTVFFTRLLEIG